MNELIVNDISLQYGVNSHSLKVFESVTLSLAEGQITGILGPNGSGKSSLIRAIAGIQQPNSGEILYKKEDLTHASVSYIPQNFQSSFFLWASLMNNIKLVLPDFFRKWSTYSKSIEQAKTDFEIDFDFNSKPANCSGGMLQQAAIVRAFVTSPNILIADEPFSALDVEVSNRLRKVFRKKIVENKIVGILISHNLEELVSMCDKVVIIPNKPYTSIERPGYFKIKEVTNNHLKEFSQTDEVSSFEKIALNLFNNGQANQ